MNCLNCCSAFSTPYTVRPHVLCTAFVTCGMHSVQGLHKSVLQAAIIAYDMANAVVQALPCMLHGTD